MNHQKYSDITMRFQKQKISSLCGSNTSNEILSNLSSKFKLLALIWRYNYSRWCEKFLVYYKHSLHEHAVLLVLSFIHRASHVG